MGAGVQRILSRSWGRGSLTIASATKNSGRNRIQWADSESVPRVLSVAKRRYGAAFKDWLVKQCLHPGA